MYKYINYMYKYYLKIYIYYILHKNSQYTNKLELPWKINHQFSSYDFKNVSHYSFHLTFLVFRSKDLKEKKQIYMLN